MLISRLKHDVSVATHQWSWKALDRDWSGEIVEPPIVWDLALDSKCLWFAARHEVSASVHPEAAPGSYKAELWRYDVAELFLADSDSGRYLELNLAPNASWWSCEFTAPRVRAYDADCPLSGVETHAEAMPDGNWFAAMSLPLEVLQKAVGFGKGTKANVTFILNSPNQRFLTVVPLGDGEPDYHRPELFSPITLQDSDLP